MIGKLIGTIDSIDVDHIIVNVNGVGYQVYISSKALYNITQNSNVSLFIETHVREDRIHLYGFSHIEEKLAFNLLRNVSGIGPRMALQILSQLTPSQLQVAIDHKDKNIFKSVSGIGTKLAEKIIIELQGRVISKYIDSEVTNNSMSELINDTISVLVELGINRTEAIQLLKNIDQRDANLSINDLVKIALQLRNKS